MNILRLRCVSNVKCVRGQTYDHSLAFVYLDLIVLHLKAIHAFICLLFNHFLATNIAKFNLALDVLYQRHCRVAGVTSVAYLKRDFEVSEYPTANTRYGVVHLSISSAFEHFLVSELKFFLPPTWAH